MALDKPRLPARKRRERHGKRKDSEAAEKSLDRAASHTELRLGLLEVQGG